MSYFSRHFFLRRSYVQRDNPGEDSDFSFQFNLVSDHLQEDNADDDWEFIEVLDKQLGVTGDEDDGDMGTYDPLEEEDSPYTLFHYASLHKIKCKILSKSDVRKRLEDKVTSVSVVLSLSRNDALLLLHHYKWRVRWAQEEWLTCEEKVRNAVGLLDKPAMQIPDIAENTCAVCPEKADTMHAVSCGHPICRKCWTDYISIAISEGPGCLVLRCPAKSCEAAVGLEMIELVASLEDKKKFDDYLLRSSVTSSKKAKWCPALDCEFAIIATVGSEGSSDVTCRCLHSFCWNCSKEAHGPVDCATAGDWMSEIIVQSNNRLLVNTRPCPCCEKLIEADSCQIYSRCTVCNYQFLTDNLDEPATELSTWADIFDIPEPAAESSTWPDLFDLSEPSDHGLEGLREQAKKSLARFNQYYEGWSSSEAARSNALGELKLLQDIQLGRLCEILPLSKKDCDLLVDAQVQVVHCWRLLKWMYVYGYYLPEHENSKRELFKFMQDEALRLVKMLARYLDELLRLEDLCLDQYEYCRHKLLRLTRATRTYYQRTAKALQSGLSEVNSTGPKIEGPESTSRAGVNKAQFQKPSPSYEVRSPAQEDGSGPE